MDCWDGGCGMDDVPHAIRLRGRNGRVRAAAVRDTSIGNVAPHAGSAG